MYRKLYCKETERRMWHHEVGTSAWRTRRTVTVVNNEDSLPGKIHSGLAKSNTRFDSNCIRGGRGKFIDKSGQHGQSKLGTRASVHKNKSISKKHTYI